MNKLLLAAPVVALCFATPAFAQAASGLRAEVRAGWDRVDVEADYDDGDDAIGGSGHENGLTYGAEVGYDAAIGSSFTVGAYAGVDFATTKFCAEVFGDDEGCLKAGRNFTFGLRAGVPVGAASLVYVKGGYTNGRLGVEYNDFEDILPSFNASENLDGLHVGAGLEFGLAAGTYAKVEYVFTTYGSGERVREDFTAAFDTGRHQLRAGIGLRF